MQRLRHEKQEMEELDIVIVGGGICGLATALALHRKGVRSVVLERSETLRAAGAAITIRPNGWRALDELGVASRLRQTALSFQRALNMELQSSNHQATILKGETRCVKRSALVEALADDLPLGTIRLGCEIISVNLEPFTTYPVLRLTNGTSIRAKVLIGCDGANSIVADFLQLKPKKFFSFCAVRGFTNYPEGNGLAPEFNVVRKGNVLCGRVPVDDKLVYWYVDNSCPEDSMVAKDPELIREFAIDSIIKDFPAQRVEMIKDSDPASLSLGRIGYRAPWDILLGSFRRGCVTVAGDAMHVMGPFLAQGGCAAIEDAVVLGRCLGQKMLEIGREQIGREIMAKEIGEALDQYVKERKMRVVWLSLQTYLVGSTLDTSSMVVKFLIVVILFVLFPNRNYHTQYDCGRL